VNQTDPERLEQWAPCFEEPQRIGGKVQVMMISFAGVFLQVQMNMRMPMYRVLVNMIVDVDL